MKHKRIEIGRCYLLRANSWFYPNKIQKYLHFLLLSRFLSFKNQNRLFACKRGKLFFVCKTTLNLMQPCIFQIRDKYSYKIFIRRTDSTAQRFGRIISFRRKLGLVCLNDI